MIRSCPLQGSSSFGDSVGRVGLNDCCADSNTSPMNPRCAVANRTPKTNGTASATQTAVVKTVAMACWPRLIPRGRDSRSLAITTAAQMRNPATSTPIVTFSHLLCTASRASSVRWALLA